MKFSIIGLFGVFATSINGAPSAQPHDNDRFSGAIQARQSNFIEYATERSKAHPLSFDFDTIWPHNKNWLGIWPAGRGPSNDKYTEDSVLWRYVPDAGNGEWLGTTIYPEKLAPGEYEAYLLRADGYEKIAGPAEFKFEGIPGKRVRDDVSFIPTSEITLANAKVGAKYEYNVKGLLRDSSGVSFSIEGESWASINDDGLLSGKPESPGDTQLSISASSGGASSTLSVIIPVVGKDEKLVSELSVMTYNLWNKGENVNDYHAKQVAFLAEADVDIVGVQESDLERTEALAEALWWWHYTAGDDRTAIISRYPITDDGVVYFDPNGGTEANDDTIFGVSVTVNLDDSKVHLWNVHLTPYPYGPYNVCFEDMSPEEVAREENKTRGPEIRAALDNMRKWYDDAPVILVGDFNAPSELDWTDETREDHCGAGYIEWPSSQAPLQEGLKDAWREAHTDPKQEPGNTWSPLWDEQELGKEPQDRIDFIYYHDGLTVERADAVMVGEPKLYGNHMNNQWTSDHKAVKAVFNIN